MSHIHPPSFSDEQNAIIRAPREARLLVVAGPGTGKTATACARVDYLISEGHVRPNRVLFVSFTRTAVAELRQRILSGAVDESAARSVRIATIDAHAWRMRAGFADDEPKVGLSYDQSLAEAVKMVERGEPDHVEHLSRIDHVIVDEAQDVGDLRARFLVALFRHLSPETGVTVFADPYQAIYGFSEEDSSEGEDHPEPLAQRLRSLQPRFEERELRQVFRTSDPTLLSLLERSRAEVAKAESEPHAAVKALREVVAQYGHDTQTWTLDDLVGRDDALVLFRSRAQVLLASYFLSKDVKEHRLRMSGLPTVASSWIAIVLSRVDRAYVTRDEFEELWCAAHPREAVENLEPTMAWRTLIKVVGDGGRLHMPTLARELAKERPHVDLCESEVGIRGPVLSTIHASKGREANLVRLMLRGSSTHPAQNDDDVEEEARVLYVAATRARERVELGKSSHRTTSLLPSGRVYGRGGGLIHVQLGCAADVDPAAHLRWPDADEIQRVLANKASLRTIPATATRRSDLEHSYIIHVGDGQETRPIAMLSQRVNADLFEARKLAGLSGPPPSTLDGLSVFGCRSVGIPIEKRDGVREPFATSGIALVPVLKAFLPMGSKGGKGRAKWGKGRGGRGR